MSDKAEIETKIGPRHVGQYPRMSPAQQVKRRAQERAHQIKFLKYVLMGLMTMQEAARALEVSLSSLDRYRGEFLRDDHQDTDDLRKLSQARRCWRSDQS